MSTSQGKYNIKAVSKMLGIQAGTLRAWERRYQMIAPKRNEAGHRLYTEQHIKILKWLISKVNQGFTISQAVSLLENGEINLQHEEAVEAQTDRSIEITEELCTALVTFDERKAHDLLNEAFSLYTIEKVTINILGTVLVKIGEKWEEGKITTAHEHFATAFLRSRIGMILQSLPVDGFLPKAIAVCTPNENHELGLLIFTLFLRRKGFEVIYLGTSIVEEDIDVVLDEVDPHFLFLSCTLEKNISDAIALIDRLSAKYKSLSIGIGGHGIERLSDNDKEKYYEYVLGATKMEWENWLKNHMKI